MAKSRIFSDFYGITHAIACPAHGLLALFIAFGIFIPASLVSFLRIPHEFAEIYLVTPIVQIFLNSAELTEQISHIATDAIGWIAFGGFIIYTLKNHNKKHRH